MTVKKLESDTQCRPGSHALSILGELDGINRIGRIATLAAQAAPVFRAQEEIPLIRANRWQERFVSEQTPALIPINLTIGNHLILEFRPSQSREFRISWL